MVEIERSLRSALKRVYLKGECGKSGPSFGDFRVEVTRHGHNINGARAWCTLGTPWVIAYLDTASSLGEHASVASDGPWIEAFIAAANKFADDLEREEEAAKLAKKTAEEEAEARIHAQRLAAWEARNR